MADLDDDRVNRKKDGLYKGKVSIEDASEYKLPFEHLKKYVKPERDENRRASTRRDWWKFGEKRPDTVGELGLGSQTGFCQS